MNIYIFQTFRFTLVLHALKLSYLLCGVCVGREWIEKINQCRLIFNSEDFTMFSALNKIILTK